MSLITATVTLPEPSSSMPHSVQRCHNNHRLIEAIEDFDNCGFTVLSIAIENRKVKAVIQAEINELEEVYDAEDAARVITHEMDKEELASDDCQIDARHSTFDEQQPYSPGDTCGLNYGLGVRAR